MIVCYLAHDAHDPAVIKRVRMLHAGGAQTRIAAFRRRDTIQQEIDDARVYDLGRTHDAKLASRAASVVQHVLRIALLRSLAEGADVIMARNLEMLAIAARLRAAYAPHASLVYECLDIHGAMLGRSARARTLRALEAQLMRTAKRVIISSPAFAREYFEPYQKRREGALLIENKVLELAAHTASAQTPPPGPPWRIGWFGNLRCARSLAMLDAITRASGGRIEAVLRGRPAPSAFNDFEASVARAPGVSFLGPYAPEDLGAHYGAVHFAWAIDYFQAGENSDWLLPNRLYEAGAHGAPSIGLAHVEAGAWLAARGAGLVMDDPLAELGAYLDGLTAQAYADLRGRVAGIARTNFVAGRQDCAELVANIA